METLTKDITLGFYNETGILTVPISQGDIDRMITISLTNDGTKFKIPNNTKVFLKAQKPDGTQINTDECCSIVDNMVQIKVFKQLSIVDGIVKCELVLSDSSGKIYTTNHFNISIQKSVHADENLKSSDTYKNIVEILLEIQKIKQDFVLKSELVDSVTSNSTTDAVTPNSVKTVNDDLQNHKDRKDNPHDVTKEQIGLENVNNTSDMDKPVSTAQQNALDSAISAHNTSDFSHSDIRLLISELTTGKVNVSDIIDDLTSTDINKPLSANQGRLLNALITELTDMINEEKDKLLPSSTADAIFATKVEVNEIKKSVSDGKTLVADAITEKGVETATDAAFATMAENISHISAGTDTSDATALAEKILEGFSAYGANGKLDGTMTNNGAISESLPINGSYMIPEGYHDGSGQITQSIVTKNAATYIPTTSDQTISSGVYLSGDQTIQGDANLISPNIVKGKTIFGVPGSAELASVFLWRNTANGSYKFAQSGDRWVANNRGINSSTATSTWQVTVPAATTAYIGWRTATESSDKISISLNGTTILSATGGLYSSETIITLNLVAGENTLIATYTKDSSVHSYGDMAYVILPPIGEQPGQYKYQSKSITPSTSSQTIYPDAGYDGLYSVSVGASQTSNVNAKHGTFTFSNMQQEVSLSVGFTPSILILAASDRFYIYISKISTAYEYRVITSSLSGTSRFGIGASNGTIQSIGSTTKLKCTTSAALAGGTYDWYAFG